MAQGAGHVKGAFRLRFHHPPFNFDGMLQKRLFCRRLAASTKSFILSSFDLIQHKFAFRFSFVESMADGQRKFTVIARAEKQPSSLLRRPYVKRYFCHQLILSVCARCNIRREASFGNEVAQSGRIWHKGSMTWAARGARLGF